MSARIAGKGSRRPIAGVFAALAVCAATAAFVAPAAQAVWGFNEFGAAMSINGQFSRQAGAHADLTTTLKWPRNESVRDVRVDIPPGMAGNPTIFDTCTFTQLIGGAGGAPQCPLTSQVGTATVFVNEAPTKVALWNMVKPPNLPAMFAFQYNQVVVPIVPNLRPSDYAISTTVDNTTTTEEVTGSTVTLWGVPADPSHDGERGAYAGSNPGPLPGPKLPFMRNPTSCAIGATPFTADVSSWQGSSDSAEVTSDFEGTPFQWDGCFKLPFKPKLDVVPGSHATSGPTGLEVDVKVPQSTDAYGLATADVRKTVVTLPRGFAISSAAASGIGSCTEAQIGLGSSVAPTCPGSSSLGTVKLKTPLLKEELDGEIFLAKQKENPFGSFLALYLAIKGPGFWIKLPGLTETDKVTGQVRSTFDNTPQLPFESLKLIFRGGSKAPLVAPDRCGTYTTQIDVTSWASPVPVHLESPLEIYENCNTGGFDPKLHAGSTNPVAGSNTPFNVQIVRQDGEQNLSRIETTLPPGLVARLAGIPLCQGAAAESGNCSPASQIGTTTIGGGAGPQPLFIPEPGKPPTHIYFGGPYKGAPYSMVFSVPAQAGPFDLGVVNVRAAVYLDPTTTQVTVKSDPLPQILEGIPIDYRDLRIEVTKPSFTLNPTNCNPKRFESTITSDEGAKATPSARFQVSDCSALRFSPKLALNLKGGTKRTRYPALRAVLTQPKGQANIAKVATTLPHSEFLANEHIQTICTRVQYAADTCPAKAVYGHATAYSPLLDEPISGPVYLRSSDHELPDLVADLGGAIDVDLVGRIDSVNGRIRTTFETVPDAPVSKFILAMQGGKKGLLVNSRNLCAAPSRAKVLIDGQNGKIADQAPIVKNSCDKGTRGKKRRH
jgi:hypothetical protein